MTDARVVNAICRFFFLALLDEQAALTASIKTMGDWRRRSLKSTSLSQEGPVLLARCLHEALAKHTKIPQGGQPVVFSEQEWIVPGDLDLGSWLEFRRLGHRDEFFVLLTVKVLHLPVAVVAAALNESEGTIRHRLGRALRQLGSIQTTPQGISV